VTYKYPMKTLIQENVSQTKTVTDKKDLVTQIDIQLLANTHTIYIYVTLKVL